MICPRCNQGNPADATKCASCGAALGARPPMPPRATYCTPAGYVILAGLAMLAAPMAGGVYHFLGRAADLFIILAALIGLGLGHAIAGSVNITRCRNVAFIAAVAVIASSVAYGTKTCLDGHCFVREELPRIMAHELHLPMRQARRAAREIAAKLGPAGSAHFYLDLQAETGVLVGRDPGERGVAFAGGVFWTLLAIEAGVVALVVVRVGTRSASAPFCDACGEWRREAVMFRMSPGRFEPMLNATTSQAWEDIAKLPLEPQANRRNCCEIATATCPECDDRMVILRTVDRGRQHEYWRAPVTRESADELYRARQVYLSQGMGAPHA